MARLSVVLPVYNASQFLQEAIDSILTQTFEDFELIVVDDGSTDSSVAIVEGISDKRITLIKNSKNVGIVESLNRGIAQAKGGYIARMDADDRSLPHRFAAQVAYLDAHPKTMVLGSGAYVMNMQGERTGRLFALDGERLNETTWRYSPVVHPTVIMRSSKNNIYEEGFPHAEDYALWAKLSRDGVVISALKEPLLEYRVHDNNVSSVYRETQLQAMHHAYVTYLSGKLTFEEWAAVLRIHTKKYTALQRLKLASSQKNYPLGMQITDQLAYMAVRLIRPS